MTVADGVQLYGNMEWVFKWLKIMLLVGLCALMIAIRAGGQTESPIIDSRKLIVS